MGPNRLGQNQSRRSPTQPDKAIHYDQGRHVGGINPLSDAVAPAKFVCPSLTQYLRCSVASLTIPCVTQPQSAKAALNGILTQQSLPLFQRNCPVDNRQSFITAAFIQQEQVRRFFAAQSAERTAIPAARKDLSSPFDLCFPLKATGSRRECRRITDELASMTLTKL